MDTKQGIVIVNEYTVKTGEGSGSRGGTPGDYVLRYMTRDGATEICTPVTYDNEEYVTNYMVRKEATETLDDEDEIMRTMKHHQGLGGRAFGSGGLSLSDRDLRSSAKKINDAFNDGKTVMKTVISFDEEYLRENGIIDPAFEYHEKGDYRGNIDQMKLRYAISQGMDDFSREYDELEYIAAIQVDTAHVHCHLAMVDLGMGFVMPDGTQKGKLSQRAMTKLRRGIDLALDDEKSVQFMASNVGIDKRNVQTNMKKFTHQQVLLYGAPQKILSVLPEDETLWRAKSNRKEMKVANRICRDYVEQIFLKYDSGISKAMQSIYDYVDARDRREDLSQEEKQALIRNGREDIVIDCMNSVYMTLRQVPPEQRYVHNDFLNLCSQPYINPSFMNDGTDFVYKLSAYSRRLGKHRHEAKRFTNYIKEYEDALNTVGINVSDWATVLYDYFKVEQEYQLKLSSKYTQILFFTPPADDLVDEYLALSDEAETVNNMEDLYKDKSAARMKPENAEEYGRSRYGVYGGRLIVLDRPAYRRRMEKYRSKYETNKSAFDAKLEARNLTVSQNDQGQVIFVRQNAYDFEEVRALDLHDLRSDFSENLEFSGYVEKLYLDMARRRISAYDRAVDYIMKTQPENIDLFDNEDVENMRFVMGLLESGKPVEPVKQPVLELEEKNLIPIDKKMHKKISEAIKYDIDRYIEGYSEEMKELERDDEEFE